MLTYGRQHQGQYYGNCIREATAVSWAEGGRAGCAASRGVLPSGLTAECVAGQCQVGVSGGLGPGSGFELRGKGEGGVLCFSITHLPDPNSIGLTNSPENAPTASFRNPDLVPTRDTATANAKNVPPLCCSERLTSAPRDFRLGSSDRDRRLLPP